MHFACELSDCEDEDGYPDNRPFPAGDGLIQTGALVHNQASRTTLNQLPNAGQMLPTDFSVNHEGDAMRLVMKTGTGTDELTLQH